MGCASPAQRLINFEIKNILNRLTSKFYRILKFDESNVVVECSLDKVWSDEHLVDGPNLLERLLLPSVMITNDKLYVASVDPEL